MNFQLNYFLLCLSSSFQKIPVSLGIALVTLLIGLLVGTPIALTRVFRVRILNPVFACIVAMVKAVPVNLIILMTSLWYNANFNAVAQALGLNITVADISKIYVAIAALSIAAIALISESVRGALMSVGKGQYEAGYSVGMTKFQTFTRIIMPRHAPAMSVQFLHRPQETMLPAGIRSIPKRFSMPGCRNRSAS